MGRLTNLTESNGTGNGNGLARGRELLASKHAPFKDEVETQACFAEALAPLEAQASKPLRGPWREKWERWFNECPEGFCRLRDEVLERPWVRSPFAYFNRLGEDGDFRLPPLRPNLPLVNVCPWCETGGGEHAADCETLA